MPIVYPATYSEAKRMVRARKLVGHQTVVLTAKTMHRRQPSTRLDVQGPPVGQGHLHVHVYSGMTDVHVVGGSVSVTLDSVWGNVAHVDPAAAETTRVTVGHQRKATVEGLPIEKIDGDHSRLYWPGKYADRGF